MLRLSAMAWYRIYRWRWKFDIFQIKKLNILCGRHCTKGGSSDLYRIANSPVHLLLTHLPSAPAPVNSPVHPLLHMPLHTYLLSTHLQIAVTKQIQMTIRDRWTWTLARWHLVESPKWCFENRSKLSWFKGIVHLKNLSALINLIIVSLRCTMSPWDSMVSMWTYEINSKCCNMSLCNQNYIDILHFT